MLGVRPYRLQSILEIYAKVSRCSIMISRQSLLSKFILLRLAKILEQTASRSREMFDLVQK